MRRGDGSWFGAFQVLKDGKWHSRRELERKCGSSGPRRARDLRRPECGGFSVKVVARGRETFYRIPPFELAKKRKEIARLERRMKLSVPEQDIVDIVHRVELSNAEIVMILAHLRNDWQLNNKAVSELSAALSPMIEAKLQPLLPEELQYPYDLFESEEQDYAADEDLVADLDAELDEILDENEG